MSDAANNLPKDSEPADAETETSTPAPAKPVDQGAQEDAGKERAREGGYD